jgi:hypothetical protein
MLLCLISYFCLLKAFCYIFYQAIVNEDTSGDVIAMRMQIQQLKVLCLIAESFVLLYFKVLNFQ